MRKAYFLSLLLLGVGTSHAAPETKLWASVSVNKPVFYEDMTHEAEFTFTIVTDGVRSAPVDWRSARLYLNKQEIKDWADNVSITGNYNLFGGDSHFSDYSMPFISEREIPIPISPGVTMPEEKRQHNLPPGLQIRLSGDLGGYFESLGIYTLQWVGSNFKAAPITFRVLPLKDKVPDIVKLVRFIRPQLPQGWRVFYSPFVDILSRDFPRAEAKITIEHIDPVPEVTANDVGRFSVSHKAYVDPNPDVEHEDRNYMNLMAERISNARLVVKTYRPSFSFVVGPRIDSNSYREMKAENESVYKLMREGEKDIPQDHKKGLRPSTPEEKERANLYWRLNGLIHDLPTFYFERLANYRNSEEGQMINGSGEPRSYHPAARKAEEERYEIEEKIYDQFPRYEDEVQVVKGQP